MSLITMRQLITEQTTMVMEPITSLTFCPCPYWWQWPQP